MVYHHLQPSFSGGEVSPHTAARAEAGSFSRWLKTAQNFILHAQGGASNRPGTWLVAQAKYAGKDVRLIPFICGDEEAYVLELGDKYVRLHTSAGPVLGENAQPTEWATPYPAHEVAHVNYVQYNQVLYLVHPAYAPQRFVRAKDGTFTWEEFMPQYGPFRTVNTNASRCMRLTQEGGEITVAGVKAGVTFQPLVYPQYALMADFNGQWFYLDENFGCNIAAMVNKFNQTFGAQGFAAEYKNGVVTVTSPAATGGDANGMELKLRYHEDPVESPREVAVYTLSGGTNAGTVPDSGSKKQILESDFDYFRPAQAGGIISLTHEMEGQYVAGSVGYDGVSQTLKSGGDWRLKTAGNWTGNAVLEKSGDGGTTWQVLKRFARESGAANLSDYGTLEETSQMYLIRLRGENVTGEMGYELWSDAFVQEGIVRLKNYLGPRKMEVEIVQAVASGDWSLRWAPGSFSPAAGFPACVFFYQDRLGLACTATEPQALWFSKIGQYQDFGHQRTLQASDSFGLNLSAKSLQSIRSVVASGGKLFVFTSGGEWTVEADGAFTAYTVRARQQGERGASRVPALAAGGRVLFVQARGGVLRDLVYDYTCAAYLGADLTLLARHLFFNREIRELALQQEPDELLWCVMSDGGLLTLTYQPQQDLCAWARHTTPGTVCGVCTVPAPGYDELWLCVRRANGMCIERMNKRLASKAPSQQLFLDSAIAFNFAEPAAQITGLTHLEGQTVYALADGNPAGPFTVRGGAITLPAPAGRVLVGLAYEAVLGSLPIQPPLADGTPRDRKHRLNGISVSVLDSRGGCVGVEGGRLDELVYTPQTAYNQAPGLQTCVCHKVLAGVHNLRPAVVFKQAEPLPVTVLDLTVEVV